MNEKGKFRIPILTLGVYNRRCGQSARRGKHDAYSVAYLSRLSTGRQRMRI
jgi:hypothetical protein